MLQGQLKTQYWKVPSYKKERNGKHEKEDGIVSSRR